MNTIKLIFLSLLFLNSVNKAHSQSFKGKVIYVSSTQEILMKFPSIVVDHHFTSKEVGNLFEARLTNDRSLSINTVKENIQPAGLVVVEGSNTHLFTLRYKENLDPNTETIYDFSTKDKLKKEVARAEKVEVRPITIKQSGGSSQAVSVIEDKATAPVEQSTAPSATIEKEKTPALPPTALDTDDKFQEIIGKANKAFLASSLDEAKALYQQALVIRPQYPWCISQLEEIEKKKQSAQKTLQQRSLDSAYRSHVSIADKAFSKKSYEVAKFEFNRALALRPGDQYATAQLQKIEQAGVQEAYLSTMNIAKKAMENNQFDNAVMSFNEALKIKPNDAEALKELTKVKSAKAAYLQKEKEDKQNQARESRYRDTLSLADNMFQAGMYELAEKKYKEADKFKPGEAYIRQRLIEIDSIQEKRKLASDKLRLDSINIVKYNAEIEKGDEALTDKNYKKARGHFESAKKISPAQTLPDSKLAEIDRVLLQLENDKKTAMQQKASQDSLNKAYSAVIKQGNVQLLREDYESAKQSFTTALQLKPFETIPVTQLEKINSKLEELKTVKKYDDFMHLADSSAWVAKNYTKALAWYDSAMMIKPDAPLPRKQSIVVHKAILENERLLAEQARNQRFQSAYLIYKRADLAKTERKFEDAYLLYNEFLDMLDTTQLNDYSGSQTYYISQAKDYLSRLQNYKPKPKPVDSLIINAPAGDGKRKKKNKKEKSVSKAGSTMYIQPLKNAVSIHRDHFS